ncbi:MAG: SDR family NAD(P)-dependent oxidoreductase [Solirubrobacteraceae bacterium]
MRLDGSKVLLTGASGGLGEAILRALAAKGAKEILITGRRADVLERLAAEVPAARALPVDLGERAELDRLLREAGEVDVLVANAGLPASGRLETYSPEQVDKAIEVNLRAPVFLAYSLVPQMVARKAGHMLFMSSLSGKAATAGSTLYNATKFGLRGFALALRQELHPQGVGVSVVLPGFIRDAGMFAASGAKLPPGIGTRTPQDVASATIAAIERNRGEVEVAPPLLRLLSNFSNLAPGIASAGARLGGGEKISGQIAEGQREKR